MVADGIISAEVFYAGKPRARRILGIFLQTNRLCVGSELCVPHLACGRGFIEELYTHRRMRITF